MKQDLPYSQFQGAVLGAVLGYELGITHATIPPTQEKVGGDTPPLLFRLNPGLRSSRRFIPRMSSSVNGGILISQLMQSLIQRQGFDAADYWTAGKLPSPQPGLDFSQEIKGSEFVWVGLSLGLFFHDNLTALQRLDWQGLEGEIAFQNGVLVVAEAIAQILTQNSKLHQLIPTLLSRFSSQTALTERLEQVQTLFQQQASLETAVRQLTPTAKVSSPQRNANFVPQNWTAFALGLYCFLTTPDDYSVTVLRSLQTGYYPDITASISGALCGAYQGLMGIPVKWRLALQAQPGFGEANPKVGKNSIELKNCETELLKLSQNLFAVWSGVYHPMPSDPAFKSLAKSAVATPNQMKLSR